MDVGGQRKGTEELQTWSLAPHLWGAGAGGAGRVLGRGTTSLGVPQEPPRHKPPLTGGAGAGAAGAQWPWRRGCWPPGLLAPGRSGTAVMSAKRESPRPSPGPRPVPGPGQGLPGTPSLPGSRHAPHPGHGALPSGSPAPAPRRWNHSQSCAGPGLMLHPIHGAGRDWRPLLCSPAWQQSLGTSEWERWARLRKWSKASLNL